MKNKNHPSKLFLILLVCLFTVGGLIAPAQAKTPQGFAQKYGLLVHQKNQDQLLLRSQALDILFKVFPEASAKVKNPLPGADCPVTQKEWLSWFYRLKEKEGLRTFFEEDGPLYRRAWLEARQNNWLSGKNLTYGSAQDFLYRFEVSRRFDHPYYEGLVLDSSEIKPVNFSDPYQIPVIRQRLINHLLKSGNMTEQQSRFLRGYRGAFQQLENELWTERHPFHVIPGLPADLRSKVTELGLKEVLSSYSYDYSGNEKNRRYNLIRGTQKLSGKVYQPGETVNVLKEFGDRNWWDYKYGWLIKNGRKEWSFGGGLSGASTMIFIPSWKAGLEIVEHHAHSIYYKDLYPESLIGLDATIFRSSKNLKIRNSTESPVLFYVQDDPEKETLTVYLIGNSPFKSIRVEGPLSQDNDTYRWMRRMEDLSGKMKEDEIMTHYNTVE